MTCEYLILVPILSEAAAPAWKGVDETVIEKVAAEAGHPAREPYINTDQGDLLLFLFLLSGAIGGFIAGYAFRTLFPPRTKTSLGGTSLSEAKGVAGESITPFVPQGVPPNSPKEISTRTSSD
ncbi:MAG: hypothetical protein ACLQNE_10325 [Thermoguttaceae bacterium]